MWTGFLLEYLALLGGNPNWAFDWWRFEMEGGFDDGETGAGNGGGDTR